MPAGTMKWFSPEKGYGFVQPDGAADGEDLFVHFTMVRIASLGLLDEGARVEFDVVQGERGSQAANVGVVR